MISNSFNKDKVDVSISITPLTIPPPSTRQSQITRPPACPHRLRTFVTRQRRQSLTNSQDLRDRPSSLAQARLYQSDRHFWQPAAVEMMSASVEDAGGSVKELDDWISVADDSRLVLSADAVSPLSKIPARFPPAGPVSTAPRPRAPAVPLSLRPFQVGTSPGLLSHRAGSTLLGLESGRIRKAGDENDDGDSAAQLAEAKAKQFDAEEILRVQLRVKEQRLANVLNQH
ncbi:hypothetical protein BDK51DRAFT_43583 [Blyttiomyces helicus]|uniref:Uncharacterized protein n=1 Tax=Blyttiomyces helicus TaxID=388810 RepID=A0A4P9VYM7_9FUNG|nr:hypothetical protein BDK51DRAFT_43583 [Blyttiomyces helicus]|eukprot:RKO83430.1 hypothetical protein BDK51DRAFT_43583 [Blyttiomyces helicus]